MDIDGSHHMFNGTLTIVPGDNLASQCLGGYKSLAIALRKCRHCMAVDDDMQTEVRMSVYMKCMLYIQWVPFNVIALVQVHL